MSTLTQIKEVLNDLMKDVFVGPSLPQKVTTYGGPEDNFAKIVETFTVDDEGVMHVDRCVQYKAPIDFISVNVKVGDVVEEERG